MNYLRRKSLERLRDDRLPLLGQELKELLKERSRRKKLGVRLPLALVQRIKDLRNWLRDLRREVRPLEFDHR